MAIGINIKKADRDSDPCASRFFGNPAIPRAWADNWTDDVLFFCRIRLRDLADADTDSRLPHKGHLYIFLDTEVFPYTPMVYYSEAEPDLILDGFNDDYFRHGCPKDAWEMEFFETDDEAEGIKLFGIPSGRACGAESPKLFMQFDPRVKSIGFPGNIDGNAYFVCCGDETDFENISLYCGRRQ